MKKIEFMNRNRFAAIVLNIYKKNFIMHIIILNIKNIKIVIYLFWITKIELLNVKKALITIFIKHSDYINVFSPKLFLELPKKY